MSLEPPFARSWQRVALGVVLGLVLLAALYLGTRGLPTNLAGSSGAFAASTQTGASGLDEARVAQLKALVAKDPADKEALFELGEMHIQAGRWQETIDWFGRLLEVDPDNLHARTDVGTAQFNLGRTDLAKQAWEEVARRDPKDPQIHYNLGYLYANGKERNLEAAKREWQTVLELAPDSDLATTTRAYLANLGK